MQVSILSSIRLIFIYLTLVPLTHHLSLAQSTTSSGSPNATNQAKPVHTNTSPASTQHLALLLPLSGKQQAAGIAIRDGFLSAALQKPPTKRGNIDIFDTNEIGVIDAYSHALQNGATMVIGPLLKDDLQTLVTAGLPSTPTLALNNLTNTEPNNAVLFQFALDPEEEARQVAQRAIADHHLRAIVLTPKNEWGQRILRAFSNELTTLGGKIIDSRSIEPNTNDQVTVVKSLFSAHKQTTSREADGNSVKNNSIIDNRDDFDFIFLAAQPPQAKQLYPAIRFVLSNVAIPIYATSDSFATNSKSTDLDGLRIPDMPWIINPNADDSMHAIQLEQNWEPTLQQRSRLYAFGIDAFKLCDWLIAPSAQHTSVMMGATGLLSIDLSGRIHRQLEWALISNGIPKPLTDIDR